MKKPYTIERLRKTKWYKTRPEIIQQAVELLPPMGLYKFKDTGKQCVIIGYSEPKNGKFKDVTVTVQKTGVGGVLNECGDFSFLDKGWNVFGVKLTDLEPYG
jgi:hypothetical protein